MFWPFLRLLDVCVGEIHMYILSTLSLSAGLKSFEYCLYLLLAQVLLGKLYESGCRIHEVMC